MGAEDLPIQIGNFSCTPTICGPYQLDRLGLTRTILSLVEGFEAGSPIRVTHSIENIDGFFPKDMEINVYRIVQEALGNILKHAEASEVDVGVTRTDPCFAW